MDRRHALERRIEGLRPRPEWYARSALELERHQLGPAHPFLDQPPHDRLARRVEVADRIDAHQRLRAQRALEQIVADLALGGGRGQPREAEVAGQKLVGLQHAGALADRQQAAIEGELQRALRWLAARPFVRLLDQHVVRDVADRQRAVPPDALEHPPDIRGLHCPEPWMVPAPIADHVAHVEAQIARRHVGERMRPVFEHRLVDRLRLAQIVALVGGNARVENLMVAALDDVDRVDLHVAEVLHRRARRLRSGAEGGRLVKTLGPQPEPPRARLAERNQSTRAPEALTTGAHRAISDLMKAPNSSGVLGAKRAPSTSRRCFRSAPCMIVVTSAFHLRTSSPGVPAGASKPIQLLTSKPGRVSATVGRSGAAAERTDPMVAMARAFRPSRAAGPWAWCRRGAMSGRRAGR